MNIEYKNFSIFRIENTIQMMEINSQEKAYLKKIATTIKYINVFFCIISRFIVYFVYYMVHFFLFKLFIHAMK